MKKSEQAEIDYDFITEIIDDLETNGYVKGGKAQTMLNDWADELKKVSGYKKVYHPKKPILAR